MKAVLLLLAVIIGFASIYLVLRDKDKHPDAWGLCPKCGNNYLGKDGHCRVHGCDGRVE